ncbi:hypothetical protein BUALT_Bualt17G0019500 [Buddleja alternifolia]|uniref:RNA helicase n=1 Tax=Buddleja alternifolia TaxID=168488 RepID=A0AAV6W5P3_9LAMI|nr:hypothetical protein BUALT_Bualt17G0019500 [Buddleja alternifolia]
MSGQEEIEATCYALLEKMDRLISTKKGSPKLLILPMYSHLSFDLHTLIYQKTVNGAQKCIVIANIAKKSLTMDGILYVIDPGYSKMKVYYSHTGVDALQVFPISRAAADQCMGCAGITEPGNFYRLYTESVYLDEMLPSPVRDIQRTNLGNVVLLFKSQKIVNLLDLDFMDSPPKEIVIESMH